MGRRQTRQTVSMSAEWYETLRDVAEHKGVSMSSLVEQLIQAHCEVVGYQPLDRDVALRRRNMRTAETRRYHQQVASGYFTF